MKNRGSIESPVVKMYFYRLLILSFLALTFSLAKAQEADFCIHCTTEANSATLNKKTKEDLAAIAEKIQPVHQMNFLDPEFVEKTDSRQLGEMIVQRLHDRCDSLRDPSKTAPDENDSEIIMLVPERNLSSILKNGFKNQHQTSSTNGANAKVMRLGAESSHVGMEVPYSNKARDLLPKYALQVFNDGKIGQYPIPWHYGNVLFRFKSNVKKRATWSETDSLSLANPLRTNSTKKPSGRKCLAYCEAQIWGGLDSTDVASLVVEEGTPITDEMKSMGVPIYTYKTEKPPPPKVIAGVLIYDASFYSCEGATSSTTNSICKTTFSKEPAFTPTSKPAGPSNLNYKEAQALSEKETAPAQKNIYNNIYLAKMPTPYLFKKYEDLLKAEEEEKKKPATQPDSTAPPAAGGYWGGLGMGASMGGYGYTGSMRDELADEKLRVLAELTARPKTQEITDLLLKEVKNGGTSNIKAIALQGLSNLKEEDLKPLLIEGIKGIGLHQKTASYMARKYKDDPEIASLLAKININIDPFSRCYKED